MKTAQEVLRAIDEEIERLRDEAADPCINALIGTVDREEYREAVRRGAALRAVASLRKRLGPEVEPDAPRRRR